WCPRGSIAPTAPSVPITSTAWFIRAANAAADAATHLNKLDDAGEFHTLALRSIDAVRTRFYNAAARSFGSQTGDAMALAFGLVPSGEEQAVGDDLARDVTQHGDHHDTGIFGSRYLFDRL